MTCIFSFRGAAVRGIAITTIALGLHSTSLAEKKPSWIASESYAPISTESDRSYAHLNDTDGAAVDEGALEIVRERFPEGNVKIERSVVLDPDGNYVNHGSWKMFTKAGELSAEGQYNLGERVGVWTRYFGRGDSSVMNEFPYKEFKAPFVAQATFVQGLIDGDWIIQDADNRKVSQISFKMGQRHGTLFTYLPNGKVYRQATFDEGVPVGDVMEVNNKSNKFERVATFVDGRKIVTKTANFKNSQQKKSEEMYLAATTVQKSADDFWNLKFAEYATQGKDLRHGPSKSWYANGKPHKEGSYHMDQKSGSFTYWHENGQVQTTGEYKNDKETGLWVWFHENGQKSAIGGYEDGVLMGQWRWWDANGKLTKQASYDGTESVSSQDADSLDVGRAPGELKSVR